MESYRRRSTLASPAIATGRPPGYSISPGRGWDGVGYSADREKCVQWAIGHTAGGILGNHDAVACGKADGEFFNAPALIAARWSAEHLSARSREYLKSLPDRLVVEKELLMVDGAPSHPAP